MRYDLHLHSYYSDGTLAPAALIERARTAGVDVMALTDHDCLDGLAEAQAAVQIAGMRLVPGVEISVTWNTMTIHILGLGVDANHAALKQGLAQLAERRHERAKEISRKLEKRRIYGAYEGVRRLVQGNIIGRAHFAQFLVREGYVSEARLAFKQYLLRGAAAYVSAQWATLDEAIGWIHAAGGQSVIAHPTRYKISNGKLRELTLDFKNSGGDAIEVACGGQTAQESARAGALAKEFGLLASAGSDYHGPETSWLTPGKFPPIPEDCTPIWHDWPKLAS